MPGESDEANVATLRRLIDAIAAGQFEVIEEVCTPGFRRHIAKQPTENLEAFEANERRVLEAVPDLRIAIEDAFASEDRACARIEVTGTHEGEFLGAAATGNALSFGAILIARFEDGRIAEVREQLDSVGLSQQLGLLPAV